MVLGRLIPRKSQFCGHIVTFSQKERAGKWKAERSHGLHVTEQGASGGLLPTATLWAKFQRQRFGDKGKVFIQKRHNYGMTAFHTH